VLYGGVPPYTVAVVGGTFRTASHRRYRAGKRTPTVEGDLHLTVEVVDRQASEHREP